MFFSSSILFNLIMYTVFTIFDYFKMKNKFIWFFYGKVKVTRTDDLFIMKSKTTAVVKIERDFAVFFVSVKLIFTEL